MNEPAEVLALEVPCDKQAPGSVRHALSELDRAGCTGGDVMLIASELVTNAVLHSGCSADDLLEIQARLSADRVTIAVSDPGVSGQSAGIRSEEDSVGGWGLQLVAKLAARWGSERSGRYRVWAEIPVCG